MSTNWCSFPIRGRVMTDSGVPGYGRRIGLVCLGTRRGREEGGRGVVGWEVARGGGEVGRSGEEGELGRREEWGRMRRTEEREEGGEGGREGEGWTSVTKPAARTPTPSQSSQDLP